MQGGFAADGAVGLSALLPLLGSARLSRPADGVEVAGVAPLHAAQSGYLSFYSGGIDGAGKLSSIPAGAIVFLDGTLVEHVPAHAIAVGVPHPRYSFIKVVRALFPAPRLSFRGVSPMASVSGKARVAAGATIAPFTVVEDEAEIGEGCLIYPGVHIARGVKLAERVVVMSGTVIGCPGQASERDESGVHQALPHLAAVSIGADTTIGANSVVVQGSLGDTRVGARCSIGNLVNIGHNAVVGDDCFISAGTVLAGSAHLEAGVWLAPGVTVLNKIRIGSEAVVGLGSVVAKSLPGGAFYAGNPARELRKSEDNHYNRKGTTP